MSNNQINSIYGGGLRDKSKAAREQEQIVTAQMEKMLRLGATTSLPSGSIPRISSKTIKKNKPVGIVKKNDAQNQTNKPKPKTVKKELRFQPTVEVKQIKPSLETNDDEHQNCINLAIRVRDDPGLRRNREVLKELQACTTKFPKLSDNIKNIMDKDNTSIDKKYVYGEQEYGKFAEYYNTYIMNKGKYTFSSKQFSELTNDDLALVYDLYDRYKINKYYNQLGKFDNKEFSELTDAELKQVYDLYELDLKKKNINPTITEKLDDDKRKDLTQFFIYELYNKSILSCDILYELYNITNTIKEYKKNIANNSPNKDDFCNNIYEKIEKDKPIDELAPIINAIPNIEQFILQNFVKLALQSLLDKQSAYTSLSYDIYCKLVFNPYAFYNTSIIIYNLFKHLNNLQDFSSEILNQLIVKLDSVDRNSEDIIQNIPELITSATFNLAKIFLKFMLIEKRDTNDEVSLENRVNNLFIADNSPFVDLLKLCKNKKIYTIPEYEYINYILPLFILGVLLKKYNIYDGLLILKIINKITDNGGNYYIQEYLVNNFENLCDSYIYEVNKLFKYDTLRIDMKQLYRGNKILQFLINRYKLTFVDTNSDK